MVRHLLALRQGVLTDSYTVLFGANATVYSSTPTQSDIASKACIHGSSAFSRCCYPSGKEGMHMPKGARVSHTFHCCLSTDKRSGGGKQQRFRLLCTVPISYRCYV